jgi:hypothetical protein
MNDTVPITLADAGHCELDWCQQPAGHAPENHVRVVDLVEPTPFNNNMQAVIVTSKPEQMRPSGCRWSRWSATASRSVARFGWTGARH